VYHNLLRTTERLCEQFDALFKAHGLTQTRYNALRILRGHEGPVPSGTVAREMVNREPDVTRLLERLERSGLIERRRSTKDRRVMLASLTVAGAEVLASLDEPVMRLHREQLAHIGAEELRTLSDLLVRARERAEPPADA
jgi:MarR family transcriptional regulator, 2-MHQ and catechol-resistance regulon repressor